MYRSCSQSCENTMDTQLEMVRSEIEYSHSKKRVMSCDLGWIKLRLE